LDFKVNWNGRQGIAIADGKKILIDNFRIEESRRGGIDLEPPRAEYLIDHVIIRNGFLKTRLLPFPMHGQGRVQNVLIEDCEYDSGSPITWITGKPLKEG